jgi:hypothetical protein
VCVCVRIDCLPYCEWNNDLIRICENYVAFSLKSTERMCPRASILENHHQTLPAVAAGIKLNGSGYPPLCDELPQHIQETGPVHRKLGREREWAHTHTHTHTQTQRGGGEVRSAAATADPPAPFRLIDECPLKRGAPSSQFLDFLSRPLKKCDSWNFKEPFWIDYNA